MRDVSKIAYKLIPKNTELPIPVERIVADHGIRLLPYDLGDNVSGVLIIENDHATIGFNKNEHRVRNRFTIAHELAHYFLHRGDTDFFVDNAFKVMYRGNVDGVNYTHEKEANEFAACLLMPEEELKREIDELELDYTDEDAVKILAKKFDVSTIAMSIRLAKLGHIWD